MDQATSTNQTLLRHLGQQCQDPNLDRDLRLRPRCDHQKAAWHQARYLHNSSSPKPSLFEKTPILSLFEDYDDTEKPLDSDNQLNLWEINRTAVSCNPKTRIN